MRHSSPDMQVRDPVRQWLSYVTEAAVAGGELSASESVAYFTEQLFGTAPNRLLLDTLAPYEASQQLLQRLYRPIVEAASRDVRMPQTAMLHVFVDVSLTGQSAALVVYFPGHNQPHRLLLLDAVKAWELVFADASHFNRWAQERYGWIADALRAVVGTPDLFVSRPAMPHDPIGVPSGS